MSRVSPLSPARSCYAGAVLAVLLLLAGDPARLGAAEGPAGPAPAPPAEAGPATPAAPAQATAPEVEALLDKLEARSSEVRSFQAAVRYDRIQGLRDETQTRFGTLMYLAGPPARFAAHFDRLLVEAGDKFRPVAQNRWYIFDGIWLVEKLDDKKQFTKRQIVAPGKEKQSNPLAEGAGPFVLPLNLKKSQMLGRFEVRKLAVEDKALPADTIHLVLTPRENVRSEFSKIDLWYDPASLLPVQVRTEDRSENQSVVLLSKVMVNESVDEKLLSTAEPGAGWDVTVTPWEENP